MPQNFHHAENLEDTAIFRALLERTDASTNDFVTSIPALCREAADRMKAMAVYAPQYTLHDEVHLLRVTELMGYVLGDELHELNTAELALLILSAYFHDQGMVPIEGEIESLDKDPEFQLFKDNWITEYPNYGEIASQILAPGIDAECRTSYILNLAELNGAILTDYLRSTHGIRSEDYVRQNFKNDKRLELNGVNLSSLLGKICLSHTLSCDDINESNGYRYDEQVGRFRINVPFLAVVLRLSDILDFDRDRTPEVLLKSIHFTSDVSIREWEKHRSVEGWSISETSIRFTIRCKHPAYESAARQYMDWIDWELSASQVVCQNQPQNAKAYKLRTPSKVDRSRIGPLDNAYRAHNLEFSLSRNEIVRLLMTDKLYGSSHLCIRELLQNSLDALRYRRSLYHEAGIKWESGKVSLHHYINTDGFEVLQCSDNGVGMDEEIVNNHLVRIGRSYYRSPYFEKVRNRLRQSGCDFDPCSKFGIGFMSCFMLGDRITIATRKDFGQGKEWGNPLIIEIQGLSGLIVVREGKSDQPVGTTVTIVCRQKPSYLDYWSDKVRLCLVLKGFALATEFPISGICSVDEISGTVEIPPNPEKEPTLIERAGVNSQVTLEQDLLAVSPNLGGYVRESFLVDENGLPALGNHAAVWQANAQDLSKGWNLIILPENRVVKGNLMDWCVPVSIDGILVGGTPGRPSFHDEVALKLGARNSDIYSKSPALIDARGDLKPEITPARTIPDHSLLERLPGWQRLNDAFMEGKGLLVEKLAEYLKSGLTGEVFWKLCTIRELPVSWIPHRTLWGNLSISLTERGKQGSWELVRDLGELSFSESSKGGLILCDKNGRTIGPDDDLDAWELAGSRHPSLRWEMNAATLLMCSLDVEDAHVVLTPSPPASGTDIWLSFRSAGVIPV